jgi:NAD(P)H-flavin reductase
MTKALKGTPPVESQKGLKDTWIAQNHFLACVCKPEGDMEIGIAEATKEVSAHVVDKTLLNDSVIRIQLQTEEPLDYVAGQFINVSQPNTDIVRSYSLASLPSEDVLELHIKRVPDGKMSHYLHDDVKLQDCLRFTGPSGDCFYTDSDLDQPLLLIAVGTGLAPLYGIVRDALLQNHRGEIHIFHGSLAVQGLYYMDELYDLEAKYNQLHYIPCVMHGDAPQGGQQGNIQHIVQSLLPSLKGWRVYICGDPAIVKGLKQSCFLAGASMSDIYSDPFEF